MKPTCLFAAVAAVTSLLITGCGQKGPSTQVIRAALDQELPPQFAVENVISEFVPGGDDQGSVRIQAQVRLTEDFFQPVGLPQTAKGAGTSEPNEIQVRQAAKEAGMVVPKELEALVSTTLENFQQAALSASTPVIKLIQKKGDVFEFSLKARAVKEGKDWTLLGFSGEPPTISGQPRSSLPSASLVEGDPTIQKSRDALAQALSSLSEARTQFVKGVNASIQAKHDAAAKEIADSKAALKDTCTKAPLYGVWSTEDGRGEIGIRFDRFSEVADNDILVEGVFFNPQDQKQTKLFTGSLRGEGTVDKPYTLRINVPQGNGVAAERNTVFNTTVGILLDECEFNVDLAFDRNLERIHGAMLIYPEAVALKPTGFKTEVQFQFSKSFTPASPASKGDQPTPTHP